MKYFEDDFAIFGSILSNELSNLFQGYLNFLLEILRAKSIYFYTQ